MECTITRFQMGKNGGLEPVHPREVPVNRIIYYDGYGKENQQWAVFESKPERIEMVCLDEVKETHSTETAFLRHANAKFGIGYYETDLWADPDEVAEALEKAIEFKETNERERPAREAAAKAEREKEESEVEALYPHLKIPESKYVGGKDVAINVRIELKRHFPNIKFSVTSESNKVNIRWIDGPTVPQIQEITSKYEDHKFDESGDFRDYSPSTFNRVFGGCNFVMEQREMSDATRDKLMEWAEPAMEKYSPPDIHCASNLAYRLFYQYAIPQTEWEIAETDKEAGTYPQSFWEIKPIAQADEQPTASKAYETLSVVLAEIEGDFFPEDHPIMVLDPSSPQFEQVVNEYLEEKRLKNGQPQSATVDNSTMTDSANTSQPNTSGVTVNHNTEKNGIEIQFATKPDQQTIDQLKAHGFRWSRFAKLWWARHNDHLWNFANSLI